MKSWLIFQMFPSDLTKLYYVYMVDILYHQEEGLAGKVVKDRQRSESELWHAKYSMACVYCQHWQAERGIKLHEEVLKHNER